jgi:hypothetical protein
MSIPTVVALGATGKIGNALIKELFPDQAAKQLSIRLQIPRRLYVRENFLIL